MSSLEPAGVLVNWSAALTLFHPNANTARRGKHLDAFSAPFSSVSVNDDLLLDGLMSTIQLVAVM